MVGVEEVLDRIIVGWSCYDYEIGIFVCACAIKGGSQIELLFSKILLNVLVLNRRNTIVDFLNLLGDDVNGCHLMLLREEGGYGKSYVTGTSYCYFEFVKLFHTM